MGNMSKNDMTFFSKYYYNCRGNKVLMFSVKNVMEKNVKKYDNYNNPH